MSDHHDKLNEVVPVRMDDVSKRFIERRAESRGFASPAAYVRFLIQEDKRSAEHEFSLLADALGVNVNHENGGNAR